MAIATWFRWVIHMATRSPAHNTRVSARACVSVFRTCVFAYLIRSFFVHNPCDLLRHLQNTKPLWDPKYTPKYTSNPLPKPKYRKTKKTKKYDENSRFFYFFVIFVFWFREGIWRAFWDAFWGSGGVLYSLGGAGGCNTIAFASTCSFLLAVGNRVWAPTWTVNNKSEPPRRGRKTGAAQKLSKLVLETFFRERKLTGWLRNRTGTGNRNRRNRFSRNRKRNRNRRNRFPGTETWTGTSFLLDCAETQKRPFAMEPNRNRKPEPLEPFHPQTVTEPNRGLPELNTIFFFPNPLRAPPRYPGKIPGKSPPKKFDFPGRLIFIHLQCWEVLPFCRFQRQRCIKIRVLGARDFYTPLALKTAKGQQLPALEVYKN